MQRQRKEAHIKRKQMTVICRLILFCSLLTIIISCNNLTQLSSKEKIMKEVTANFIQSLKNGDTLKAMSLFDSTPFYDRDFYEASILFHGAIYRKVVEKYGEASLQNLTLEKDSIFGANLANLPLLPKPDTSLNLKYFNLKLKFYPDQWFNGKIWHYSIDVGVLVHRKAEAPPTN